MLPSRMFQAVSLGLAAAAAAVACAPEPTSAAARVDAAYRVTRVYTHDPGAFTQGLSYVDGRLWESTGRYGESSVRMVNLETGAVLRRVDLPPEMFGEGSTPWGDVLVVLTWTNGVGLVFDRSDLSLRSTFRYAGEGWGLTNNGRRLIRSDGGSELRFLHPETLAETGRLRVTDDGRPVDRLNELEWVKGEVWANVWGSDRIACIHPETGVVRAWLDLSGLLTPAERGGDPDNVLNGIAYDPAGDRIFVTGKRWPKLFEIEVGGTPSGPGGP